MRRLLILLALLTPLACSTVDANYPGNSEYPTVSGPYTFIANLNENPSRYNGQLNITRTSLSDPTFGGTYTLTLTNTQTGQNLGTSSGNISSGLLGRDSTFQAHLTDSNFRLSGQVNKGVITGAIVVNSSSGFFTGAFTAIPRF